MRVLVPFGTRLQVIKMVPIVASLNGSRRVNVEASIAGQLRETQDQFLGLYNIRAEYDLDVVHAGTALAGLISRILERFDAIPTQAKSGIVRVRVDSTASFAAALSSFYRRIPVLTWW